MVPSFPHLVIALVYLQRKEVKDFLCCWIMQACFLRTSKSFQIYDTSAVNWTVYSTHTHCFLVSSKNTIIPHQRIWNRVLPASNRRSRTGIVIFRRESIIRQGRTTALFRTKARRSFYDFPLDRISIVHPSMDNLLSWVRDYTAEVLY